ncbi:MAG: 23S rRNA (adenine(2503)-C(2))-methyltransferase RlmN [Myxococcota bacterium]|nr:23S rRNA (adenine(2503)-C(2))-methyltransferase RlmN [Myxococcota bacterium]
MTRGDLRAWVEAEFRERAFRGDQLFKWLHGRGARSFDGMTDLSKALRGRLESAAHLGGLELDEVLVAKDGTRKLLLRTWDGHRIETVVMPMADRITQCISSQVGCKIGCDFCLTARMAKRRDLTAAEIVDQVLWGAEIVAAPEADDLPGDRVNNLVYMGMGEPLDNFDAVVDSIQILMDDNGQNFAGRRITVSTSGVASKVAELGSRVPVNLALSLNASTDATRDRLIPINRKWNIDALLGALDDYPLPPRRRITVEYVLLADVNDSLEDARQLRRLLHGLRPKIKVNLIPFNPWPGASYARPEPERVEAFGKLLRDAHFHVTVRYSKGDDIGAACGQLDGAARSES